jgi:hypothetical protein
MGGFEKAANQEKVKSITGPFLQLNGTYVLKNDLQQIIKIWGEGPPSITPEDVGSLWTYNLLTKQFEAVKKTGFDSTIDAVSY